MQALIDGYATEWTSPKKRGEVSSDWIPVESSGEGSGADRRYHEWRNPSLDRVYSDRKDFMNRWTLGREGAGGREHPSFYGDATATASVDPRNISLVRVTPKDGAYGTRSKKHDEWQVTTGAAIDSVADAAQAAKPGQREFGFMEEQRAQEEKPPDIRRLGDKDLKSYLNDQKSRLAEAAQRVYDDWSPDDEFDDYGGGGICDAVANAMSGILSELGFEVVEGGQEGDDHAYLFVHDGKRAFSVDIPASVYETGGGYSWRKRPDVTIDASDVEIYPVDIKDILGEDYEAEEAVDEEPEAEEQAVPAEDTPPENIWMDAYSYYLEETESEDEAQRYAEDYPHVPNRDALPSLFKVEGYDTDVTQYWFEEGEGVVFEVALSDSSGSEAARFEMAFQQDSLHLRFMDVIASKQGQGIGMNLFERAISLASQAGVGHMRLEANKSVGGYAWALMGVDFESDSDREDNEYRITEMFETVLDKALRAGLIDDDRHEELLDSYKYDSSVGITAFDHATFCFDLPPEFDGVIRDVFKKKRNMSDDVLEDAVKYRRFGKAAMLGARWFGTFDLSGDSKDVFDSYKEKRSKR